MKGRSDDTSHARAIMISERTEQIVVEALRPVECVVAVYVRDPHGDAQFEDVRFYVAVRPYGQASIDDVRDALLPVIGVDGLVQTHVNDDERPYRAMLMDAREVFRR